MATRHALTPADLGPRASLLVDKHAAYIASFSNIWEVRVGGGARRHTSCCADTHNTRPEQVKEQAYAAN